MESQFKSSNIDGTQMRAHSQAKVANPRSIRSSDFILRLLAIAATLVPAIIMGLAKEKEMVEVYLFPQGPPVSVLVPAKTRYSSALVYFVVANAIACAYAALSLVVTIGSKGGPKGVALGIAILDVIMVGLLFSGNGAAATVGLLGAKGNSHVGWNKICDKFGKFCRSIGISLVVSLIGSVVFTLLVLLSTINLHRRSR